jgi:MFS family permease
MSDPQSSSMTGVQRRAVAALAAVVGVRMLGMFLILPVFALYARGLPDASPELIGLALGAYGLTQALLQIPFGWLSDRHGRKPVIYAGLALFAAGSLLAALADGIWGILAGRALQGAGAVAAVVMALASDLTPEQQRAKAMAAIGMGMGGAFMLALVLGPVLDPVLGVPGLFGLTAVLAVLSMLLVAAVPNPPPQPPQPPLAVREAWLTPALLRLNVGVFLLHATLVALFLAFPLQLRAAGLETAHHWRMYLPVLLGSVALMLPLLILGERRRAQRGALLLAGGLWLLALLVLAYAGGSLPLLALGLLAYFTAFNLMEASLPSLLSRMAPARHKGLAMGVFTTTQFAGAFLGGAAGGWVLRAHGEAGVFFLAAGLALLWLPAAAGLQAPPTRVPAVPVAVPPA